MSSNKSGALGSRASVYKWTEMTAHREGSVLQAEHLAHELP